MFSHVPPSLTEDEFVGDKVPDLDLQIQKTKREELGLKEYTAPKEYSAPKDQKEFFVGEAVAAFLRAASPTPPPAIVPLTNTDGSHNPIPYKPMSPVQLPPTTTPAPLVGPPTPGDKRSRGRKSKYNETAVQNSKAARLSKFLGNHSSTPADPTDDFSADPPALQRSLEMQLLVKERFEKSIGKGFWEDEVASTIAADLDASSVYNPRAILMAKAETAVSLKSVLVPPPPLLEEEEEALEQSRRGMKTPDNHEARSRPMTSNPASSKPSDPANPLSSRPVTAPVPNSTLKKAKIGASLTEVSPSQQEHFSPCPPLPPLFTHVHDLCRRYPSPTTPSRPLRSASKRNKSSNSA